MFRLPSRAPGRLAADQDEPRVVAASCDACLRQEGVRPEHGQSTQGRPDGLSGPAKVRADGKGCTRLRRLPQQPGAAQRIVWTGMCSLPRARVLESRGVPASLANLEGLRPVSSGAAEPLHGPLHHDGSRHRGAGARIGRSVLSVPHDGFVQQRQKRRLDEASLTGATQMGPVNYRVSKEYFARCSRRIARTRRPRELQNFVGLTWRKACPELSGRHAPFSVGRQYNQGYMLQDGSQVLE